MPLSVSFPRRSRARLRRTVPVALLGLALVGPLPAAHAQPAGSTPAEADPVGLLMYPEGVGADLGPEATTLGLAATAGENEEGLVTGEFDGRGYWATDLAAGTDHLALTADDEWLAALPQAASRVVSVTYRDTGADELLLNSGDAELRLPVAGEDGWRTAALELPPEADGSFRLSGEDGGEPADITVAAVRMGIAGANATLGPAPSGDRVVFTAGDNAAGLVTGDHEGRTYWRTDRAAGTTYFYANVADTHAYAVTGQTLVSVDYLDDGPGSVELQYDSPEAAFKAADPARQGGTGEWLTHTFALDDAQLTNRANNNDFRLAPGGGDDVQLTVAAVRIAVLADGLEPTAGLLRHLDHAERVLGTVREGDRDGQYPPGTRDALRAVIDTARAVADDPATTEERAKDALRTLHQELTAAQATAHSTNLARGAAITASSGAAPEAAVDGSLDTAWHSSEAGQGEWLTVDLGEATPVNDVRLSFADRYPSAFTVQTSLDGEEFTDVREGGGTGPDRGVRVRFDTVDARHVRVALHGYGEGATRQTVTEFEIREERVVTPEPRLVETEFPTDDWIVADFDATDFGADPTGERDSTDAIQRAVHACVDAGGGTVWLPSGSYLVTDTIEVHAFCTVRGDRNPDYLGQADAELGTVLLADLAPGDDGPSLFRIGGSAGVIGVSTYYPNQSAAEPVPYNHTFEIPGRAWIGNENYMMATVAEVTLLNSYRGIGISTMPSDQGEAPSGGQTHESTTLRDIQGTALFEGVRAYNGADVGTWQNVHLNNRFWAEAPTAYDPPERAALDAWTRANGTGLVLGDLEWDEFIDIGVADYRIGIDVVEGQRINFAGSLVRTEVRDTDIAVRTADFTSRWGFGLVDSVLEGSEASVQNRGELYVKLTDTELVGPTSGTVYELPGEAPAYEPATTPRAERGVLQVTDAPRGVGVLPETDATDALQATLDAASADGGGIVYLPAGWYRVDGHLRVPADVELRGSSPIAHRDLLGASGGTVLFAREGRGTDDPEGATALITLDGDRAGVHGLRVFYPENNPGDEEGLAPYPFTVRGNGTGTYVVNVGMPNAWNGVDMATHRNDGFVIRKLSGAFLAGGITVGDSAGGRIEGVLSNGNATARVGYALPDWGLENQIFPQVIDTYTRAQSDLVTVAGARDLQTLNVFGYGYHSALVVESGEVTAFNLGSDNLHEEGYTVHAGEDAEVTAVNVMRYNGTTSTGPVTLLNVMALYMVNHPVTAEAAPEDGGTVTVRGNMTEPGAYEEGSEITVTAEPADGFRFDHWESDGEPLSTEPTLTLPVTAPTTLEAHFTES
ncbi:discoidin domain-containing protein [Streptomyces profundus]|uniref:discoidin domain-containing protein n=1 Tax=Streptomyces profundus TaxID=2867410 RepID=UPI001D15FDF6|nr:discoidin domain-containing protein [Streptomyces sp. MA3_2.13]UED84104.1 discoidin domain-containing protein [Streptomyces sp. MA3_2.13]